MTDHSRGKEAAAGRLISPFLEVFLECPLCGRSGAHQKIKSKVFADRKRDIDLRPMEFICAVKSIEPIHPPLYYMFFCRYCCFAAGSPVFAEPFTDSSLPLPRIREAINQTRNSLPWTGPAIQLLTAGQDARRRDYLLAIKLTLLGILFLEIDTAVKEHSMMNLGRYYLRLAWLFRETKSEDSTAVVSQSKLDDFFARLHSHWPEAPADEETALHIAASLLGRALDSTYSLETPLDQVELVTLVARVYIKLNDFARARRYLSAGKDIARKAMNDASRKLRGPESLSGISAAERTALQANVRKLQACIDHAQDIFSDILGEWEMREEKKALEIMTAHPKASAEELLKMLLGQGISASTAQRAMADSMKRNKHKLCGRSR